MSVGKKIEIICVGNEGIETMKEGFVYKLRYAAFFDPLPTELTGFSYRKTIFCDKI